MNKHTKPMPLLISCLALLMVSTDCSAEAASDTVDLDKQFGKPWTVITTNIPPMENLVRVNDTMRLKKTGSGRKYMLRPDPLLLGRWGQATNFIVHLEQSDADERVYCGDFKILGGGKEFGHQLALSEVRSVPVYDDAGEEQMKVTDVTLYFYGGGEHPDVNPDPKGCSFHDIHGGLAHVHGSD